MPTLKQLLEELRKINVDPDEPQAPKRIEKNHHQLSAFSNYDAKGSQTGNNKAKNMIFNQRSII